MKKTYFTSEHVSPGHPDKIMDSIAESIVDYHLEYSTKTPRVAVDGLIKNNKIVLAGEITSTVSPNLPKLVEDVVAVIGYNPDESPEFNSRNFELTSIFTVQSPDIAQGVDASVNDVGAGDIGIMFGGAVDEAPDYTCWSHYLARLLSYEIFNSRSELPWVRPDQKVQVTIEYNGGLPVRISEIVLCVSHEHAESLRYDNMKEELKGFVDKILYQHYSKEEWVLDIFAYKIHINPTGRFEIFGPVSDSGLVGRKIVCDQYGGFFPVGGGNLNGKDATKVDRSAVYMARFVAKHIVACGMANKCQIQVAYSIGQVDPISINIETFGTNLVDLSVIEELVGKLSFKPKDIIERFNLSKPFADRGSHIFSLGMYGHIGCRFGLNKELPWEESLEDSTI